MLYKKKEAAEILSVSTRTLDRIWQGFYEGMPVLKVIRIGSNIRFHKDDLEDWIERVKTQEIDTI